MSTFEFSEREKESIKETSSVPCEGWNGYTQNVIIIMITIMIVCICTCRYSTYHGNINTIHKVVIYTPSEV